MKYSTYAFFLLFFFIANTVISWLFLIVDYPLAYTKSVLRIVYTIPDVAACIPSCLFNYANTHWVRESCVQYDAWKVLRRCNKYNYYCQKCILTRARVILMIIFEFPFPFHPPPHRFFSNRSETICKRKLQ